MYFTGGQGCQSQNQLNLFGLDRLESVRQTAQGGIRAQVHVGFIPRAVSPAGPLAIPTSFEFTSPYAEEGQGHRATQGVQVRSLVTDITTEQITD